MSNRILEHGLKKSSKINRFCSICKAPITIASDTVRCPNKHVQPLSTVPHDTEKDLYASSSNNITRNSPLREKKYDSVSISSQHHTVSIAYVSLKYLDSDTHAHYKGATLATVVFMVTVRGELFTSSV